MSAWNGIYEPRAEDPDEEDALDEAMASQGSGSASANCGSSETPPASDAIGGGGSGDRPVAEWVGLFKQMAGLLAQIEESAAHTDKTEDWSDKLCDCAFFAQRVAHVMLELQPQHLALLDVVPELLRDSIAHYGNPADESFGVGLVHAKARAAIANTSGGRHG